MWSFIFTSLPFSTSNFATSSWSENEFLIRFYSIDKLKIEYMLFKNQPAIKAQCKGVVPLRFVALTSLPLRKSKFTTFSGAWRKNAFDLKRAMFDYGFTTFQNYHIHWQSGGACYCHYLFCEFDPCLVQESVQQL